MSSPVFIFTGQAQELDAQLQNTIAELTKATAAVGLKPTPIGTAVEECCHGKLRSGLSPKYVTGLRQYLTAWAAGQESKFLHDVTTPELEAWFAKRGETPAVRESNRGRLSALFCYGARRSWVRDNPTLAMDRHRIVAKTPQIIGPRKAMRLLLFALKRYPQHLAYAVLCVKVGLRPYETVGEHGIGWKNIDFVGKTVVVDALSTKVRCRRVVQLSDDEVEWLRLAKLAGSVLPLSRATQIRWVKRCRHVLGYRRFPSDLLRHTAVSALLARTNDIAFTARNAGNSPVMILRHYLALMNRPTAERYLFKPKPRHWKLAAALGEARQARENAQFKPGESGNPTGKAKEQVTLNPASPAPARDRRKSEAIAVIPFPIGWVKKGLYRRDHDGEFTLRERQTMSLISEGKSDTQIAHRLCLSPGTVNKHVMKVMHRLGCHTRGEALRKYVEKIGGAAQEKTATSN